MSKINEAERRVSWLFTTHGLAGLILVVVLLFAGLGLWREYGVSQQRKERKRIEKQKEDLLKLTQLENAQLKKRLDSLTQQNTVIQKKAEEATRKAASLAAYSDTLERRFEKTKVAYDQLRRKANVPKSDTSGIEELLIAADSAISDASRTIIAQRQVMFQKDVVIDLLEKQLNNQDEKLQLQSDFIISQQRRIDETMGLVNEATSLSKRQNKKIQQGKVRDVIAVIGLAAAVAAAIFK